MNSNFKKTVKPAGYLLASALLIGSTFLFSGPLSSEEEFDYSKIKTGLKHDSQALQETVPMQVLHRSLRGLPSSADLTDKMPPIGSQGAQNSCVGWATTYAIKSFHESKKNNWNYGKHPQQGGSGAHYFSPAWTYNQINGGRDEGSSYYYALKLLKEKGAVSWQTMPYSQRDYRKQPTSSMKSQARQYRIKDFRRLDVNNPNSIKAEIAKGNPVLTGVLVHKGFYQVGKGIVDHNTEKPAGGHAIVFIGYDDSKRSSRGHNGAYKILNSWGTNWGNRGYGWISYRHFAKIAQVAYAIEDASTTIEQPLVQGTTIAPPATVSATRGSYKDRVVVSWGRVNNAIAYQVQRRASNESNFSSLGTSGSTQYNDSAVQQGMTYRYRVVSIGQNARSDAGKSPVAEGYALNESNKLPDKVLGFTATASGNRVNLQWQATSGASKYRIVRWDYRGQRWKNLTTSRSTSATDRRPIRNQANYYYVRAEGRGGNGQWSNLAKVSLKKVAGPPDKVNKVSATQGRYSDKIQISWNSVASADSYVVYRWSSESQKWDQSFVSTSTSMADSTSSVKSGQPFVYVVKAKNSYGLAANWSPYAAGFTQPQSRARSLSAPVVQDVTGEVNEKTQTITLKWARTRGIKGFKIYRQKEGEKEFKLVKELGPRTRKYTAPIQGSPGDLYFYSVRSVAELGAESADSELVAGYINLPTIAKRTVFDPAEGLNNFTGSWKAIHWVDTKKSIEVELKISSKDNEFIVETIYGRKKKKFTGGYANKSRYLQSKKFYLELLEVFENDIAKVVFSERALVRDKLTLNFERQK